jgi:hypothetical protein
MGKSKLLLLLILFAAACYHDPPKPEFDMTRVLSEDSMVVLLTDLQLVDGAVSLKARGGKPVYDFSKAYTDLILQKHHVEREVFNESIRYYSFYVEKMDAIYEKVINNLTLIQSQVAQPAKE